MECVITYTVSIIAALLNESRQFPMEKNQDFGKWQGVTLSHELGQNIKSCVPPGIELDSRFNFASIYRYHSATEYTGQ